MFYLNSTLNFGIPPVLMFKLEVYYKVDRLLTGPTAQQNGTNARWYSNKTSTNYLKSKHCNALPHYCHIDAGSFLLIEIKYGAINSLMFVKFVK